MLNWEVVIDEAANRDLKPATRAVQIGHRRLPSGFTTVQSALLRSRRRAITDPKPQQMLDGTNKAVANEAGSHQLTRPARPGLAAAC
jgi:hypothetical protein